MKIFVQFCYWKKTCWSKTPETAQNKIDWAFIFCVKAWVEYIYFFKQQKEKRILAVNMAYAADTALRNHQSTQAACSVMVILSVILML